jgi:inosine-uridine nucleoside N-ribohydrolase
LGRGIGSGNTPYRTVIDCDTGVDDALALLAAVGSPELDVEFVTTVAGNALVEHTTENTLRVLALAGRWDIPVYRGAARPMMRDLVTGSATHGVTGLAGPSLPESPVDVAGDAGEALASWCAVRSDRPKRLISIGPLTNLGGLLAADPNALAGVQDVFVMGGTISGRGGALSPHAETNFFIDPEAARLVLHSGVPVHLVDYDATSDCLISPEQIAEIGAATPPAIVPFITSWLDRLHTTGRERFGREGVTTHDLYAVASAAGVQPGGWERFRLEVGVSEDERGVVKAVPGNESETVSVARGLDPAAMVEFFVDAVSRLR